MKKINKIIVFLVIVFLMLNVVVYFGVFKETKGPESKDMNQVENLEKEESGKEARENLAAAKVQVEDTEAMIINSKHNLLKSRNLIEEKIINITEGNLDNDNAREIYGELSEMKEEVEKDMETIKEKYDEYLDEIKNLKEAVRNFESEINEEEDVTEALEELGIYPDTIHIKEVEIEMTMEESEENYRYFNEKFEEFEELYLKQAK